MKKNFIKKLALVMALTVAATSVPANVAEAASTPDFRSKAANLTVGQTKNYGVTDGKRWSVKFKIGNTKVATIDWKQGDKKVAVTGEAEGTTTLRADFKAYKTKRTHTERIKVYVKAAEAATVAIKGEDESFVAGVGTPYALTADVTGTTADVEWSVAEEGATVVDGKFTATKTGEFTVTAKAGEATATQKITVKTVVLKAVNQTAINKVELTFAGDVSKVAKEDVVITRSGDEQTIYVRKVSAKGQVVTAETILPMTDSKVFTVSYQKDTPALTFTATDGVVAALKLNTTEIQYQKPVMIKVVALDTKGVELVTFGYDEIPSNYDFVIDTTQGYVDGDSKLVLHEVGNTAKVTAVYHTYKYDDNANEIGAVKFEGVVTAVEKATTGAYEKYTIAAAAPADWDEVTENHEVVIGEATTSNFYMLAYDSFDEVLVDGDPTMAGYTLTSSNEDVFIVAGNALYGNKAGSAFVIVKDSNDNVVWTMPVIVKGEAVAKTLHLSNSVLNVSNATPVAASAKVTYTVKDNYQREIANANLSLADVKITCKATPNRNASVAAIQNDIDTKAGKFVDVSTVGTISFYGTDSNGTTTSMPKGTYVYELRLLKDDANFVRTVTVNVQQPSATAPVYRVVINGVAAPATVDTEIKLNNTSTRELTIKLGEFKGGVLAKYVDVTSGAVDVATTLAPNKKPAVVTESSIVAGQFQTASTGDTVTFSAMTVDGLGRVAKAKEGTYVISVKDPSNALRTIKQTITIKDETPDVKYIVRKDIDATTLTSARDAAMSVYKFVFGKTVLAYDAAGAVGYNALGEYVINTASFISMETGDVIPVTAAGTTKTFVKTITFYAPADVAGTIYWIPVTATINNFVEHM